MREEAVHPSFAASSGQGQRGFTLLGLLFWGVVLTFVAILALRVLPTVQEYWTILRTVNKVAQAPGLTAAEIRSAFERQKQVDDSISSLSGQDLEIKKTNGKVVVSFAYTKEVPLFGPAFLLLKYQGKSQ